MIAPKAHLEGIHRGAAYDTPRHDFLRLDMNECVDGLPESFFNEVMGTLTPLKLATYPSYRSLIEKIAASERLAPENVQLTNGSDSAIKLLFEAYIAPGDKVIITDPTFAMYPVYSTIAQGESVLIPYERASVFPLTEFCAAITRGARMAAVVNPNNPTGAHLEQKDIRALAELCRNTETLLVVDEAYFHYLEETAVSLLAEFDNVVILRTFSKLCGMAALRLGYALGHPSIITAMKTVKPTFDVNGFAVAFAEHFMDHPELTEQMLETVNNGRAWLVNQLDAAGLAYNAGRANFVLIHCPSDAVALAARLKETGILVASGFRQPLFKNAIRVTLGSEKSMQRFWKAFSSLMET